MFSTAGTIATMFLRIPSAAAARTAASIPAPPAMSYFIFSMPSHFFKEMPPVSNVTPLPTRALQGAPRRPPRYSATTSRGGASPPRRLVPVVFVTRQGGPQGQEPGRLPGIEPPPRPGAVEHGRHRGE